MYVTPIPIYKDIYCICRDIAFIDIAALSWGKCIQPTRPNYGIREIMSQSIYPLKNHAIATRCVATLDFFNPIPDKSLLIGTEVKFFVKLGSNLLTILYILLISCVQIGNPFMYQCSAANKRSPLYDNTGESLAHSFINWITALDLPLTTLLIHKTHLLYL